VIKLYKYEITKYNPDFRDEKRRYLKEDWIGIGDIGKSFEGEMLTVDKYKEIEDSYINAIHLIMDYMRIPYLTINDVRRSFSYDTFQDIRKKIQELYSKDVLETYLHVKDRDKLDNKKIDLFCRLLLREDIGAEVYYPRRMKVFIGYDYLMGIHTSKSIDSIIPSIEQMGLFVEKH